MMRYLPWLRLSVGLLAGVFLVWGGFAEEVRAGCLGTVHCNIFSNNGTPGNKNDDWCDPMSYDNVSCEAATTENACNVTYDWQNSCDDKRCYDSDSCSWSGGGGGSNPTPTTTTTTQPTPTGTSNDYGERCRIDGKVEYYDNRDLTNAANVVKIITDNINENYSTDGSGNYSLDKKYSNVWGNSFTVRVNNPYSTYRTFKVKGNVPNGCSIIDGGKTISCPKEKCYERTDGDLAFNFEEMEPDNRPNADFTAGPANNSKIGYGLNYQWTNSATDANGNMKSWGIYVRETGGSFTPIGWSSNNSGVASATLTSNTWTCSKKNQEYEVAVNAKEGDPPLLECSGGSTNAYNITSTQAQTRCASGDDLRKVTCVVPSCTFTAAPTNVSTGAAGAFSASSNNAELIQMQYRLKGTETCSRWQAHHSSTRPSIQTTGRLEQGNRILRCC